MKLAGPTGLDPGDGTGHYPVRQISCEREGEFDCMAGTVMSRCTLLAGHTGCCFITKPPSEPLFGCSVQVF